MELKTTTVYAVTTASAGLTIAGSFWAGVVYSLSAAMGALVAVSCFVAYLAYANADEETKATVREQMDGMGLNAASYFVIGTQLAAAACVLMFSNWDVAASVHGLSVLGMYGSIFALFNL